VEHGRNSDAVWQSHVRWLMGVPHRNQSHSPAILAVADGLGKVHEIKHDGYRMQARCDGSAVRLPSVAATIGALAIRLSSPAADLRAALGRD
jgi:hypothetical protein